MKKLFSLVIGLMLSTLVFAQDRMVALDNHNEVFVIDKKMERKYSFFPQYQPFVSAKLFEDVDSGFTLELHFYRNETLTRETRKMTATEVAALRDKVTTRINSSNFHLEQSGRNIYLISSALTSVGYHGWAIPKMAGVEDPRAAFGAYLGTATATYLSNYFLVKNQEISYADGKFGAYGQFRGLVDGLAASYIFDVNPNENARLLGGMIGSLAEGVGFLYLSKHHAWDSQTFEVIKATSFWGAFFGVSGGLFAGFSFENESDYDALAGSYLIGSAGSIIAGHFMSRSQDYSKGDIGVLHASALGGALLPAAVMSIFGGIEEPAFLFGGTAFGVAGGILVGHLMTENVNFSKIQGNNILGSTVLGMMGGAALGAVVTSDTEPEITASSALIGAAVGAVGMYLYSSNKHYKSLSDEGVLSRLDIQLNPQGLFSLNKPSNNIRMQQANPLLVARFNF